MHKKPGPLIDQNQNVNFNANATTTALRTVTNNVTFTFYYPKYCSIEEVRGFDDDNKRLYCIIQFFTNKDGSRRCNFFAGIITDYQSNN